MFYQNLVNIDPRTYDFENDWSNYWVQRIPVYYNEAMQKIIDTIGANYNFTLRQTNTTGEHTTNGQHSNENRVNGNRINEEKQDKNDPIKDDRANDAHHSVDDDNLNADNFSITNDKPISTGNDDNVIEIGKQNVLNFTFSKLYVFICMKAKE